MSKKYGKCGKTRKLHAGLRQTKIREGRVLPINKPPFPIGLGKQIPDETTPSKKKKVRRPF